MTFVEWLTSPGPPNWAFVLALLTTPVVWREWLVTALRERVGFPPKKRTKAHDE